MSATHREWRRAPTYASCGLCGIELLDGAPAVFIKFASMKRELIRCQACVGEAPPPLPERIVRYSGFTKPAKPLKTIAAQTMNRLQSERPRYGEDR